MLLGQSLSNRNTSSGRVLKQCKVITNCLGEVALRNIDGQIERFLCTPALHF